jgi:hypothetical protein
LSAGAESDGEYDAKKIPGEPTPGIFASGDSAEARTQDPILKRDVLYQLSY